MRLVFSIRTSLSLHHDNPLGLNSGYNYLERPLSGNPLPPYGSAGDAVRDIAVTASALEAAGQMQWHPDHSATLVLPPYATAGKAATENKIIPGPDILVSAMVVTHDECRPRQEIVRPKSLFRTEQTRTVYDVVGNRKFLAVNFDFCALAPDGRNAPSFVKLWIEEPSDAAGQAAFDRLVKQVRAVGAGAPVAAPADSAPGRDILIHPTIVPTRTAGQPPALRDDAMCGLLERCHKILRGLEPPSETIALEGDQFAQLLRAEITRQKPDAAIHLNELPDILIVAAKTDKEPIVGMQLRRISQAIWRINLGAGDPIMPEDLHEIHNGLRAIDRVRPSGLADPKDNQALNGVRAFLQTASGGQIHLSDGGTIVIDQDTLTPKPGAVRERPGGTTRPSPQFKR